MHKDRYDDLTRQAQADPATVTSPRYFIVSPIEMMELLDAYRIQTTSPSEPITDQG